MESDTEKNKRLLASLHQSLQLAKARNRQLLEQHHQAIDDLARITTVHGTTVTELVREHLPKHDPGYIPHPELLEQASRLDEMISARSLPPMKPSTLMSRIISQRI